MRRNMGETLEDSPAMEPARFRSFSRVRGGLRAREVCMAPSLIRYFKVNQTQPGEACGIELSPLSGELWIRCNSGVFDYFQRGENEAKGLVSDKTLNDCHASIAATGMALATYPMGGVWFVAKASITTSSTCRPEAASGNASYRGRYHFHFSPAFCPCRNLMRNGEATVTLGWTLGVPMRAL